MISSNFYDICDTQWGWLTSKLGWPRPAVCPAIWCSLSVQTQRINPVKKFCYFTPQHASAVQIRHNQVDAGYTHKNQVTAVSVWIVVNQNNIILKTE
jgi:hypothetical protein